MKILSLGSLNIDLVYSVDHINLEGETISAKELETKQLNMVEKLSSMDSKLDILLAQKGV